VTGRRDAGTIVELTTDGIAASERLAYWRESVLRRMEPVRALEENRPFRGRLRRIIGLESELIEHATDAVFAVRKPQRCRADGCDDITIDLMLACTSATLSHGGERRVCRGDLPILDYSRPIEVTRSRHRTVGIILPRRRLQEIVGNDLSRLAGSWVPTRGIGALLRQHMRLTLDEAPLMSPGERVVAVAAAADMALAALAAEHRADIEQAGDGLHRAARRLIERDCANFDLAPALVAMSLKCSRASLYRAFARHGESVAAVIWTTRLDRAWRMLTSGGLPGLPISEIAVRSGFLDQATFSRMFKHRYGCTPSEARERVHERP
jgi:AraC-like DNA-binding protein